MFGIRDNADILCHRFDEWIVPDSPKDQPASKLTILRFQHKMGQPEITQLLIVKKKMKKKKTKIRKIRGRGSLKIISFPLEKWLSHHFRTFFFLNLPLCTIYHCLSFFLRHISLFPFIPYFPLQIPSPPSPLPPPNKKKNGSNVLCYLHIHLS